MLKKTVSFVDFDGNNATEDCYFNLSESELLRMNMIEGDGLQDRLNKIIESGDGKKIMNEFEKIILMCYGKRSEDGKRFYKSDDIKAEFLASLAYDALFTELLTDSDLAAKFIRAVVPAQYASKLDEEDPRARSEALMQGFKKKEETTISEELGAIESNKAALSDEEKKRLEYEEWQRNRPTNS